MKKTEKTSVKIAFTSDSLFKRVVDILECDRTNVIRSINSNMVVAYWLIGREIVQELQRGKERAEYGKRLIGDLSDRLTKRYGEGYSVTSLKYFRTFYLTYTDRIPEISRPLGDLLNTNQKGRPTGIKEKQPSQNITARKKVKL